jgi:hypothetical protein
MLVSNNGAVTPNPTEMCVCVRAQHEIIRNEILVTSGKSYFTSLSYLFMLCFPLNICSDVPFEASFLIILQISLFTPQPFASRNG